MLFTTKEDALHESIDRWFNLVCKSLLAFVIYFAIAWLHENNTIRTIEME